MSKEERDVENRRMDLDLFSNKERRLEQVDVGVIDESGKSTPLMMIRKLKFKIKLPENPMMMRSEEPVDEEYVCSLCRKGFRSRKALGGHTRVHALRRKQDQPNAFDTEEEEDDGSSKAVRCPICERDFPSNKALFGHMRCHPERSWRGIQPPMIHNSSSSSTLSHVNQPPPDDDDDVVDNVKKHEKLVANFDKDLLGFRWGAKAIRGRDAITTTTTINSSSSHSSAPPEAAAAAGGYLMNVEPEEVDGVQSLILLSQGDEYRRKLENNQLTLRPTSRHLDHDSDIIRGKRRKNYSPATTNPNKKLKVSDDDAIVLKRYNAAGDHNVLLQRPKSTISTNNDHRHEVGNMEVVERYKCTACNKCFSSHQALGGHKSSHNKSLRNNNSSTLTAGGFENWSIAASRAQCHGGDARSCIGEHTEVHCTTTTTATASSTVPLVAPAVASQDEKGVFRDFDLNEPPRLEGDDNDNNS